MSGDQLNLDVFVEWAALEHEDTEDIVLALVAEVRRLRGREARMLAMADMIERGEWGQTWPDINVHGAIRSELNGIAK